MQSVTYRQKYSWFASITVGIQGSQIFTLVKCREDPQGVTLFPKRIQREKKRISFSLCIAPHGDKIMASQVRSDSNPRSLIYHSNGEIGVPCSFFFYFWDNFHTILQSIKDQSCLVICPSSIRNWPSFSLLKYS